MTRVILLLSALFLLATGAVSAADPADVGQYVANVLNRVESRWVQNDKRVLMWFTVTPSGDLSAVRTYIPSPDKNANLSAENAVRTAGPFGPTPDGKELSFTLGFYDGHFSGCPLVTRSGDIMKETAATAEEISEYQTKGKPTTKNWQYIDGLGRPLSAAQIPAKVQEFVSKHWSNRDGAMALLQVDTRNVDKSQIAATQWRRGYSSCSVREFENGIMVYATEPETTQMDVRKMGYETIVKKLPPSFTKGKVVWLGKTQLKPYIGPLATVSGTIVGTNGTPLKTSGKATIGLNGADIERTVELRNGTFTFNQISPGEYLVEVEAPGYKIDTWFAEVNGNTTKKLTAKQP